MNTWTESARRTLERYLHGTRVRLAAVEADPDEVVDDLRHHIETELSRSKPAVITERDVQHVIGRVGGPLTDSPAGTRPGGVAIDTAPEIREPNPWWGVLHLLGGVILPVAALVTELITGLCSIQFLDPLRTWVHIALIALVPVANVLAWRARARPEAVAPGIWWMNAMAAGVAAFYSILFLPGMPFALIGLVVFGLGLLPLAPFFALLSAVRLRRDLRSRLSGPREPMLRQWRLGFLLAFAVLAILAFPTWLTRVLAPKVASGSSAEAAQTVGWLRRWGDSDLLLRDSYGTRRGPIEEFIWPALSPDEARMVFYRITGQPFNAVSPPRTLESGRNRFMLDLYEFGGLEEDSALGGDAVAGRVRGLTLLQSRLDGICDADRAWSYLEWILEFKNDHETSPREARAQIQLPPGGVVSRVTLWVNGEEREAAFAGRAQVRDAYERVAVIQRRDPVLVTMCGPDRVLMQCFPVAPRGGTMKIRLGITSPLILESEKEALMTWPVMVERNFALARSLSHSIWAESSQEPRTSLPKFVIDHSANNRTRIHGELTDSELALPAASVRFARDARASEVGVALEDGRAIQQRLVLSPARKPPRIAVVIDGSREMTDTIHTMGSELERYDGDAGMGVWLARDGALEISAADYSRKVAANLGEWSGVGGQDNVPALLRAWDWAAQRPGSVVLWIHGPQPVLLSSVSGLEQRLQWHDDTSCPRLYDLAVKPGPNRLAEGLPSSKNWETVVRRGDLAEDLQQLFSRWNGTLPTIEIHRELLSESPPNIPRAGSRGSHLLRLWGRDAILRMVEQRRTADAISLAGELQLVTPVSGAVVLETAQQFQQAGLTPVSSEGVPVVPEPGTLGLVIIGFAGWWVLGRSKLRFWRERP